MNEPLRKCIDCGKESYTYENLEEHFCKDRQKRKIPFKNLCKDCRRARNKKERAKRSDYYKTYNKEWRKNNKEHHYELTKQWREDNKDRHLDTQKRYYLNNKEKVAERDRVYREKNKDKIRLRKREYLKKRLQEPVFKLRRSMSRLIHHGLSGGKSKRTEEILGCTFDELYLHLALTFLGNYGRAPTCEDKIEIDHIKPMLTAKTEQDVYDLNHYSNLQWLLKEDNLMKRKEDIKWADITK